MIEKLSKLYLPVDTLIQTLARNAGLLKTTVPCRSFKGSVTLKDVTDPRAVEVAKQYITLLLGDRERYGYLYFLNSQPLLIPLNVQFKDELFIPYHEHREVKAALEQLASAFACQHSKLYEITLVELFYFFIRLANPQLSWIAIEYILQSVQWHAHLILSRDRPHSWIEI